MAVAAACGSLAISTTLAGEPGWTIRQIPLEQVIVQAHHGAGDLAPEGSLEAFELGWKLGCVPEADLRMTRDGVIVSFHDDTLARILPHAPPELKKMNHFARALRSAST